MQLPRGRSEPGYEPWRSPCVSLLDKKSSMLGKRACTPTYAHILMFSTETYLVCRLLLEKKKTSLIHQQGHACSRYIRWQPKPVPLPQVELAHRVAVTVSTA